MAGPHRAVASDVTVPLFRPKIGAKKYSTGTLDFTVTWLTFCWSWPGMPLHCTGSAWKLVMVAAALLSVISVVAAVWAVPIGCPSAHARAAANEAASAPATMFRLIPTLRPRSNTSTSIPSMMIMQMATIMRTAPCCSSRRRTRLSRFTRTGTPP